MDMVTFSLTLIHALEDWDELVDREKARRQWRGDDKGRALLLKKLVQIRCVNFKDFFQDEVLAFMLKTYPRGNLFVIGKRRSEYLKTLFDYWDPELEIWASTLWRFTGKSCNLFSQVIAANRGTDIRSHGRTLAKLGMALFRDLPRMPFDGLPYTSGAMESVIGALVQLPLCDSLARIHEKDILNFTQYLSPAEVGTVCRHLLMFRARPKNCTCGWRPGENECKCPLKTELDPGKEYAFALFRLIGERHSNDYHFRHRTEKYPNNEPPVAWTGEQEADFLRAACNVVFSAGVYKEIYQNLKLNEKYRPHEPPLPNPRKLTDAEQSNNYTRPQDEDYSNAFSQHGGCMQRNCKQILKRDCANVSCKSHCQESGMLPCSIHKHGGLGIPPPDLNTPVYAQGGRLGNGHVQGSGHGSTGPGENGDFHRHGSLAGKRKAPSADNGYIAPVGYVHPPDINSGFVRNHQNVYAHGSGSGVARNEQAQGANGYMVRGQLPGSGSRYTGNERHSQGPRSNTAFMENSRNERRY